MLQFLKKKKYINQFLRLNIWTESGQIIFFNLLLLLLAIIYLQKLLNFSCIQTLLITPAWLVRSIKNRSCSYGVLFSLFQSTGAKPPSQGKTIHMVVPVLPLWEPRPAGFTISSIIQLVCRIQPQVLGNRDVSTWRQSLCWKSQCCSPDLQEYKCVDWKQGKINALWSQVVTVQQERGKAGR